ncbi:MAG: AMP-binding protein [Streptosporangiaceae bacterium]
MEIINTVVSAAPRPDRQATFLRLDSARAVTLADLHEQAGRLARALHAAGLRRRDRIGILAANRLEWVLLDLAALRLGAVTAGFEPGKFDPGTELLDRYDLSVLFTDRGASPRGRPPGPPANDRASGPDIRPITDVDQLITRADPDLELPDSPYGPEDPTTIKFTSGSTGQPKGITASAGSIDASISAVQGMFDHGEADNLLVFLPLSLLQQRYWIYSALRFGHDVTVSTYEAAFAALRRARPTVVMGVPGFYETARRQIERRAGPGAADEVTRAAAQQMFGGRIRYLWTGSAPARPATLDFFTRAGLPIYEGYGLNETCIVAKNYPGAARAGSVGRVLPGKKVLLDADGVISIWSEHPVSRRYEYAAAGESQRVFAPDGTVRTGDLGYLDSDGFLVIQGRADDVIVLDNGKKVIVRPLEEYLKASPAIEECVVLCPTQTHLVAVVSPATEPADAGAISARLAAANTAFGRDEQIRDVIIAPQPFSVANGMLTSQFKPRRQEILAAHQNLISAAARDGRT